MFSSNIRSVWAMLTCPGQRRRSCRPSSVKKKTTIWNFCDVFCIHRWEGTQQREKDKKGAKTSISIRLESRESSNCGDSHTPGCVLCLFFDGDFKPADPADDVVENRFFPCLNLYFFGWKELLSPQCWSLCIVWNQKINFLHASSLLLSIISDFFLLLLVF